MATPSEINSFWIDEVGPEGWYQGSEALDQTIRDRFLSDWSRNLFRDDARAFSMDSVARTCASDAIDRGFDLQIALPQRQFFYTPFMHSEDLADQDRSVALYAERMSDLPGEGDTLHARAHREIIRKFGRFPYRNSALGRETTKQEDKFLTDGGYEEIVEELEKTTS